MNMGDLSQSWNGSFGDLYSYVYVVRWFTLDGIGCALSCHEVFSALVFMNQTCEYLSNMIRATQVSSSVALSETLLTIDIVPLERPSRRAHIRRKCCSGNKLRHRFL